MSSLDGMTSFLLSVRTREEFGGMSPGRHSGSGGGGGLGDCGGTRSGSMRYMHGSGHSTFGIEDRFTNGMAKEPQGDKAKR